MRSCSQPKCTFSILSSLSKSVQPGQTLCQDVRFAEYGEESSVCIYTVHAFSVSLKYIDLDKKDYFNLRQLSTKIFCVLTDIMQKIIWGLE